MSRIAKIILVFVLAIVGVAGWIGYRVYFTVSHIPEAYAAWDTGTLLIEYMKANDDRWPSSWGDLLTAVNPRDEHHVQLRGRPMSDNLAYARTLQNFVAVDWHFDPSNPGKKNPVTRLNGKPFPVVWEEPNETIARYLHDRAATQPSNDR